MKKNKLPHLFIIIIVFFGSIPILTSSNLNINLDLPIGQKPSITGSFEISQNFHEQYQIPENIGSTTTVSWSFLNTATPVKITVYAMTLNDWITMTDTTGSPIPGSAELLSDGTKTSDSGTWSPSSSDTWLIVFFHLDSSYSGSAFIEYTITYSTSYLSAPTLLEPADSKTILDDTPTLDWNDVSGADSYRVQVDTSNSFTSPLDFYTASATSSYTTSTLADGTYYWRIAAFDSVNYGSWSLTWSFTITTPLASPIPLSPNNGTIFSVSTANLDWTDVTNAAKYHIIIDTSETFSTPLTDEANPTVSSYTFTTTTDGVFYWKVQAIENDVGQTPGNWSSVRFFTVDLPLTEPSLLTPFDGQTVTVTSPVLDWTDISSAVSYDIEVDDNSNFLTPEYSSSSGTSDHIVTGTLGLATYYWRVRAVESSGTLGLWSSSQTFVVATSLPAPTLSSPGNSAIINNPTPFLDWTDIIGYSNFQVQVDNINTFVSPEINVTTASSSYTTTTLADGDYYWQVRALENDGTPGTWSSVGSFTIFTPLPAPSLLNPLNGQTITDTTPALDWTSVSSAVSYDIEIDNNNDFSSLYYSSSSAVSNIISGNLAFDVYYWRVRAVEGDGTLGTWSTYRILVVAISLPAPTLSSPGNSMIINNPTPFLDWTNIVGYSNFQVQVDDINTFVSPEINVTTTSSSYTTTTLADGDYYWRIRALENDGTPGTWSSVGSFTIFTPLPAPSLLNPLNGQTITDTTPGLNWTSVIGAVSYDIEIDDASDFSSPIYSSSSGSSDHTVTGSLGLGTYYWRIRAVESSGTLGNWSTDLRSFILASSLPAPNLVSPADSLTINIQTLVLNWTEIMGYSDFQVQVDDSNTFDSLEYNLTISDSMYTISSLADGTYYWRIRVLETDGSPGTWSIIWSFSISTGLAAPDILSPQNGTKSIDSIPTLDWGSVSGASSYQVQIGGDSTFSTLDIDTTTSSSLYIPSSLDTGTYYWRVRAFKLDGTSGNWSLFRSFLISKSLQAPFVTLPLNETLITNSTIIFDWSDVTGASSYQIYVANTSNFYSLVINTNSTLSSYTATFLQDGTYYWQVRTLNFFGDQGVWNGTWIITIDTSTPGVSRDLAISISSFTLPGGTSESVLTLPGPGPDGVLWSRTSLDGNTDYRFRIRSDNGQLNFKMYDSNENLLYDFNVSSSSWKTFIINSTNAGIYYMEIYSLYQSSQIYDHRIRYFISNLVGSYRDISIPYELDNRILEDLPGISSQGGWWYKVELTVGNVYNFALHYQTAFITDSQDIDLLLYAEDGKLIREGQGKLPIRFSIIPEISETYFILILPGKSFDYSISKSYSFTITSEEIISSSSSIPSRETSDFQSISSSISKSSSRSDSPITTGFDGYIVIWFFGGFFILIRRRRGYLIKK